MGMKILGMWLPGCVCLLSTFGCFFYTAETFLCRQSSQRRVLHSALGALRNHPPAQQIVKWLTQRESRSSSALLKYLNNRLRRIRRGRENEEVMRQLPHMIDTITLGIAAGLPFDQSLLSYTEKYDTILARSFGQALQYWQTGLKLRNEALDDLAIEFENREITRFVSALQQSLTLGTALVYVLESQASQARDAHRQHLETQIAKAPVKMLFPMASCVIPSLLLLVLGPVVIDIMRGLGSGF